MQENHNLASLALLVIVCNTNSDYIVTTKIWTFFLLGIQIPTFKFKKTGLYHSKNYNSSVADMSITHNNFASSQELWIYFWKVLG